LRISIIGAGRVGKTLGRLVREAGYEVGDVICRSRGSARRAARFIGAGRAQPFDGARLLPVDLLLISTPDDQIDQAVSLLQSNGDELKGAVVLHTSGALSSEALSPLADWRMSAGSCHPLQTFAVPARALALVRRSYFCIEGHPRAVRAARRLVRSIGARHFEVPTNMKPLYHAAAVLASGGVVSLLSVSLEALAHCGLDEKQSRKILLPLVEGTVENVREVGPVRALTGPVQRGDRKTIERNMEALARIDERWLQIYRSLASPDDRDADYCDSLS
jgi:predicted short-subunit dehydrogenase-like oxidoreductase (DUF2520 family)